MNKIGKNMTDDEVKKRIQERFYSGETNISALAKEFNLARDTVRAIVKSDPVRYEQAVKETEKKVLDRFYSGETNISALAKEFNLARNTVKTIIKNDPVLYERTITYVRQKNADKEKKRKNEAAKRCHQQRQGKDQDEYSRAICEYFWRIKCTDDDYGRYSEYKTAEHFGINLQDVVEALRTDPGYSELEKYREEVIEKKMAELQEQNAISMSKRVCLSPQQAVMLNRNAYSLSQDRKRFTYSLKKWAVRPADLPQSISANWINPSKEAKDKIKAEEWNSETEQQAIGNNDKPVPPGSSKKKKKKHRHKKK
jgi:Mor family transcriptional regulator